MTRRSEVKPTVFPIQNWRPDGGCIPPQSVRLIDSGELRSINIGRRRFITVTEVARVERVGVGTRKRCGGPKQGANEAVNRG